MSTKKKTALASSAAALLTAVFMTLFGGNSGVELEGSYEICKVHDYKTAVYLSVPEEFTPDVFVLKMGDMEIDKGILPDTPAAVHPIVTSDLSRLSVIFYMRGEPVGVGTFSDDGVLLIKVKEGVLDEA